MRPLEAGVGAMVACALLGAAHAADEAPFRHSAPIDIEQAAPFVRLPLPPSAYARSEQPGLRDLRIVDARGQRVPFAVLAPRADEQQTVEQQHDAVPYPLPPRPAAGGHWTTPIEVRVSGDRVSVVTRTGQAQPRAGRSGGWLFDLGEHEPARPPEGRIPEGAARRHPDARDAPPAHALRLQWSGPAEFSAAFSFDSSDDLRAWRHGGHGQVMALSSAHGALTQPVVPLPAGTGRFVRLAWADASNAPAISGARVVTSQARSRVLDAPTELTFAPLPEPPGKSAADAAAARALHFDLGGALPLRQIDLRLAGGTRVVPVRVQGRNAPDQPWHELANAVFYRLERGADVAASPALALRTTTRYLRVLPDARAPALEAESTRLVVQAQLGSLVFANQGQAPFTLLAGSHNAAPSSLPLATLVPALDDERPRFGRASLQPWTEVVAVARAAQARQQLARWRPVLLWTVLLVGVLALAAMVWKLARDKSSTAA
jgi:hypothetical protein